MCVYIERMPPSTSSMQVVNNQDRENHLAMYNIIISIGRLYAHCTKEITFLVCMLFWNEKSIIDGLKDTDQL